MPKQDFYLKIVEHTLENGLRVAEVLGFPDLINCANDRQHLTESIQDQATEILAALSLSELYQRRLAGTLTISNTTIEIASPARSVAWRNPVTLNLPTITRTHNEWHICYVPALGISVLSKDAQALADLTSTEIRTTLIRTKLMTSLAKLVWLSRSQGIEVVEQLCQPNILTPKQLVNQQDSGEDSRSLIPDIIQDLTSEPLPIAYERDQLVAQMAHTLTARNAQSLLLVGAPGVGKTACLYQLVRLRATYHLASTPFWATSGAKLIAGMSGFGMWQQRCQKLIKFAIKERAILYVGNLLELIEVGKSVQSSTGIAAFLRPYIQRGDLLVIAEATPEQLPIIERQDPHLLHALYQTQVKEPDQAEGWSILKQYVQSLGFAEVIKPIALEILDRLHRRYVTYSAYPGRPLRFLKNLLAEQTVIVTESHIYNAFSQETGIPLVLLDENLPLDLTATREWFTTQVIGQPAAVDLMVDLLAMIKARLTRSQRPIASLLFIGPTGVGKTEMAKALAQFIFQDRQRIIRFDMSEYADPVAVQRLIGGSSRGEGLLTAKVREQPFSILLFDEFEKADALFFDLLLQVLGEGRLTDAQGRLADFRNTVIIMTSNLGAASFQKGTPGFAQTVEWTRIQQHFTNEVRNFLRPEMFNRIDRIVPFAPLDQVTILRIAERELAAIRLRDGLKFRPVTLQIASEVASYLAETGYDARYGARPLKRALEQKLLVPLAEQLNNYSSEQVLQAHVSLKAGQIAVAITVVPEPTLSSSQVANQSLAAWADKAAQLRRDVYQIESCAAYSNLHNEIFRLKRLQKKINQRKWKRPEDLEAVTQLPRLEHVAEKIQALTKEIVTLEDKLLLTLYSRSSLATQPLATALELSTKEYRDTLMALYALEFKKTETLTLAIFSEHPTWLFELAETYWELFTSDRLTISLRQLTGKIQTEKTTTSSKGKRKKELATSEPKPLASPSNGNTVETPASNEPKPTTEMIESIPVHSPQEFLNHANNKTLGLVFTVQGTQVYPRYESEQGIHTFIEREQRYECLVVVSNIDNALYKAPPGISRRGYIGNQDKRRSYNLNNYLIEDMLLKKKFPFTRRFLAKPLAEIIEEYLFNQAQALIES